MQWCLAAKAKSTLNSSITAYRSSRLPVLRSRSTSARCWCPCSLRRSVSREADLEAIAAPNHEGNGHRKHWEQNHEADVRVLQRRQVSHEHWRLERFQWCRTCRWCHCFNSPRHFHRGNEAKGKRAQDVAACCHTQQHYQGWAARSGHVLRLWPTRSPKYPKTWHALQNRHAKSALYDVGKPICIWCEFTFYLFLQIHQVAP